MTLFCEFLVSGDLLWRSRYRLSRNDKPKTLENWFMGRNILKNMALANLTKISCTGII